MYTADLVAFCSDLTTGSDHQGLLPRLACPAEDCVPLLKVVAVWDCVSWGVNPVPESLYVCAYVCMTDQGLL